MKCSEIEAIMQDFVDSKSPYKCILIDGAWGIGKTYAVKHADTKEAHIIYTSLFGMKDISQLRFEMLAQISEQKGFDKALRWLNTGTLNDLLPSTGKLKILAKLPQILNSMEFFCKIMRVFKTYLENDERELVFIFDDLERKSEKLNVPELLGLFDSIRNLVNAKIILIANAEAMDENYRNEFDLYIEKIVDRTYTVDELSKAMWESDARYDKAFVDAFYTEHKFCNLRTLQKAQSFFEDVKNKILNIIHEEQSEKLTKFIETVRAASYAIVFESIEEQCGKEKEEPDTEELSYFKECLKENIDMRIKYKYLLNTGISDILVEELIKYYKVSHQINKEVVIASYKSFETKKKKSMYYNSQEEIQSIISDIKDEIETEEMSILEICEKSNTALIWMKVLDEDTSEFSEKVYKKILNTEKNTLISADESLVYPNEFLNNLEFRENYEELGAILSNVTREVLVVFWRELFAKSKECILEGDFEKCYFLLRQVREYKDRTEYDAENIKKNYCSLLIPQLSPSGSINEYHNRCVRTLCEIDNAFGGKYVKEFLEECVENASDDKILLHRVKYLNNHFYK